VNTLFLACDISRPPTEQPPQQNYFSPQQPLQQNYFSPEQPQQQSQKPQLQNYFSPEQPPQQNYFFKPKQSFISLECTISISGDESLTHLETILNFLEIRDNNSNNNHNNTTKRYKEKERRKK